MVSDLPQNDVPAGIPPWSAAPAATQDPYAQGSQQGYPQQGDPQQGYPQPALANWGQRVGAFLLDGVITGAPYLVAGIIALATLSEVTNLDGTATFVPSGVGMVVLFVGWAITLGLNIWNRYVRQGRTGQSIGKSILKLRLISVATGQPIGGGMAFVRDLAHIADGPFFVGYLFPLWDARKQTFADKMVNTVVVVA